MCVYGEEDEDGAEDPSEAPEEVQPVAKPDRACTKKRKLNSTSPLRKNSDENEHIGTKNTPSPVLVVKAKPGVSRSVRRLTPPVPTISKHKAMSPPKEISFLPRQVETRPPSPTPSPIPPPTKPEPEDELLHSPQIYKLPAPPATSPVPGRTDNLDVPMIVQSSIDAEIANFLPKAIPIPPAQSSTAELDAKPAGVAATETTAYISQYPLDDASSLNRRDDLVSDFAPSIYSEIPSFDIVQSWLDELCGVSLGETIAQAMKLRSGASPSDEACTSVSNNLAHTDDMLAASERICSAEVQTKPEVEMSDSQLLLTYVNLEGSQTNVIVSENQIATHGTGSTDVHIIASIASIGNDISAQSDAPKVEYQDADLAIGHASSSAGIEFPEYPRTDGSAVISENTITQADTHPLPSLRSPLSSASSSISTLTTLSSLSADEACNLSITTSVKTSSDSQESPPNGRDGVKSEWDNGNQLEDSAVTAASI